MCLLSTSYIQVSGSLASNSYSYTVYRCAIFSLHQRKLYVHHSVLYLTIYSVSTQTRFLHWLQLAIGWSDHSPCSASIIASYAPSEKCRAEEVERVIGPLPQPIAGLVSRFGTTPTEIHDYFG